MPGKSRLTRCFLGLGALAQGVFLMAIPATTLGDAFQAADILYAEDFDRIGQVPAWFASWHCATRHELVIETGFFLSGLALALTASPLAAGFRWPPRWFEGACWTALFCSLSLAVGLTPLYFAGDGWPLESPAGQLRRRLLTSLGAVCLETLTLVVTITVAKAMRGWEAKSAVQS